MNRGKTVERWPFHRDRNFVVLWIGRKAGRCVPLFVAKSNASSCLAFPTSGSGSFFRLRLEFLPDFKPCILHDDYQRETLLQL